MMLEIFDLVFDNETFTFWTGMDWKWLNIYHPSLLLLKASLTHVRNAIEH